MDRWMFLFDCFIVCVVLRQQLFSMAVQFVSYSTVLFVKRDQKKSIAAFFATPNLSRY